MTILKWYSIIYTSLSLLINLIGMILVDDLKVKLKCFIADIFISPILIFSLMI